MRGQLLGHSIPAARRLPAGGIQLLLLVVVMQLLLLLLLPLLLLRRHTSQVKPGNTRERGLRRTAGVPLLLLCRWRQRAAASCGVLQAQQWHTCWPARSLAAAASSLLAAAGLLQHRHGACEG
jgi:hypothetical protein